MTSTDIFTNIAAHGVVPVLALENVADALPLADALIAGGLPILEVTFRTAAAAEIIKTISHERRQILVGAGTVLTAANLEAAKASGAAFAVAPGLNPKIVKLAQELELPFIPGIATPSDIECGLDLGCHFLKFFPAEAAGGLRMLEAFSAPYAHTGVRFMPTGGVNPANLDGYLKHSAVAAVGGTWIAKKEDLARRNWEEVRDRCRAVVEMVRRFRPPS